MPRAAALGNPLRDRFTREILIDGHANRAALRAGYTHPRAGEKLLQIPEVIGQIKKLHRSRLRRLQMEADEVVMGWSRIARFNPTTLFDENGSLKPPHQWPEEIALCIASIEIEDRFEGKGDDRIQYRVHKIKFNDRIAALRDLGRYHNLFADAEREQGRGIGQGLTEGLADMIQRAQQEGGGVRELIAPPLPPREALPEPDKSVVAEQKPTNQPVLAAGLVRRITPPVEKKLHG